VLTGRLLQPRARSPGMGELHADMGLSPLRAREDARAILTEEPREQLAGLARTPMHQVMVEHGQDPHDHDP
jgi:hypothetical protein